MQSSLEVPYQSRRRGHVAQLSISDDTHHVTEAIGDMYGDGDDDDWNKQDSSRYSFVKSPSKEPYTAHDSYFEGSTISHAEPTYAKTNYNSDFTNSNGPPMVVRGRNTSFGNKSSSKSTPQLSRTPSSDTASQAFPLNDIDYESSPAAVAQELSNLQAIRRMSMNVDAADPDLPTFGPGFVVPTIAPGHGSDEDDASRLFWVPASLHPELAPKEFKTFIQDRVDTIRRRSGEGSLSPERANSRGSTGSIKRRKSTLSRSIDTPIDYSDGADRLERKRSQSNEFNNNSAMSSLQELEFLVNDPSNLVRTLSLDTARKSLDSGADVPADDMPILPPQPAGQSLKRSTRTNYRRGSLRKGERVFSSRRAAGRLPEGDGDETPTSPTSRSFTEGNPYGISRAQTEPLPQPPEPPENFSRPSRKGLYPPLSQPASTSDESHAQESTRQSSENNKERKSFHSRIASNGRTTASMANVPQPSLQVPQIIETPPPAEYRQPPIPVIRDQNIPERKSSHEFSRNNFTHGNNLQQERLLMKTRPGMVRQGQPLKGRSQTLDDMANNPSMLPGNSTRTDALSFIPTYAEERKPDKRSKDRKDQTEAGASRKSSWGWLLGGGEDKEKERDRKERDDKDAGKKTKLKLGTKSSEKSVESARLDLLQTATESSRGRESLVLDRDSYRLEEERKKETYRKVSGSDSKKSKESGIFSFLGGGKKKADRDTGTKKRESNRGLSPEPPRRTPVADVDYNWTRFSILEERAIYRMAHIKLANPRRALYSQVLLSNFMYSYLAKVQQMHPQIQIPTFVTQKQQQSQHSQQAEPQNESDEFSQWQHYQHEQQQQQQQSLLLPHDGSSNNIASSEPAYIDDYDQNHHQHHEDSRHNSNGHMIYEEIPQQSHKQPQQPSSLLSSIYGSEGLRRTHDQYAEHGTFETSRRADDEDMW